MKTRKLKKSARRLAAAAQALAYILESQDIDQDAAEAAAFVRRSLRKLVESVSPRRPRRHR